MESVTLSDPAEDALGFQRWLRPQRSAPRALDLYTPRGCGQAAGGPQGATAARIPPPPPHRRSDFHCTDTVSPGMADLSGHTACPGRV